jgi:hypothetical protein
MHTPLYPLEPAIVVCKAQQEGQQQVEWDAYGADAEDRHGVRETSGCGCCCWCDAAVVVAGDAAKTIREARGCVELESLVLLALRAE